MAVFVQSFRLVVRRATQRQHTIVSPTKRQKSHAPERPSESSSSLPIKSQAKSISTAREVSLQPIWERLGPLSEVFGAYARSQKKRPWATSVATSLIGYLCGDLLAQKIDGESYDPLRTLRHLTIGGICSIPAYSW